MGDNKGITLVELIVVISLLAVLVGGIGYGASLLIGRQATGCANNISVALDKAKSYASTRSTGSDAYMEIFKDSKGKYVAVYYVPKQPHTVGDQTEYKELERMELGSGQLELKCYFKNPGNPDDVFVIDDTKHIRIYYDRISGAMKDTEMVVSGSATKKECTKIAINGSKKFKITFSRATGRHTLEKVS